MNWLLDGEANAGVSPLDRGLAYGDGVFRTLKVRVQQPVWWRDHYAKLAHDCAVLKLACPAPNVLLSEIQIVTQPFDNAVVKIVVTRGPGERGYAPPEPAAPTRIVMASALSDREHERHGIHVRWCSMRLARQAQLAGIKHLNRLENVLARQEWSDPDIAEGLLCDDTGAVIGGTRSNVFAMRASRLLTPDLSLSGIAGVTRDRVLRAAARHAIEIQVARLEPANIMDADEVFVSNSLVGLSPVAMLDQRQWRTTTWTEQFQQWIDETD